MLKEILYHIIRTVGIPLFLGEFCKVLRAIGDKACVELAKDIERALHPNTNLDLKSQISRVNFVNKVLAHEVSLKPFGSKIFDALLALVKGFGVKAVMREIIHFLRDSSDPGHHTLADKLQEALKRYEQNK